MRINLLYKVVLAAEALCVAPAALPAFPSAGHPGTKPSDGAFPISASNLLQQVQNDAISVRNNADQLQALTDESFETGWGIDGDLLIRMRARVNEMDKLLTQLRANKAEALPWQQEAIERIAPSVVNLTDTTESAITTLNRDKGHIFMSDLGVLADHMYDEAKLIDQEIGNFEKYANARQKAQQLR
jgi:hypothetical protein